MILVKFYTNCIPKIIFHEIKSFYLSIYQERPRRYGEICVHNVKLFKGEEFNDIA